MVTKQKFNISLAMVVMFFALLFFIPTESKAGTCGIIADYETPVLTATANGEGVFLEWDKIDNSNFKNYIVVISRNNSEPYYSAYGYLTKITNPDTTAYIVDNSVNYTSGDFTSPLEANESYYFVLSVEYECGLVKTSEAVQVIYPELNPPDLITPSLSSLVKDDGSIILNWNDIDHEYLKNYRVVISSFDSTPNYPDNGYLATANVGETSKTVDNSVKYTAGDIDSYLQSGSYYYFSVTSHYQINSVDYYTTSNILRIKYNGPSADNYAYYQTPNITKVHPDSSGIKLEWDSIEDTRLNGYQIIIGYDASPIYSQGYLVTLGTDISSYTIDNSTAYIEGNFGKYLEYGEIYNYAVVALYNNNIQRTSAAQPQQYKGPLPVESDYLQFFLASTKGGMFTSWNRLKDWRLTGYKFIISKDNASPTYPGNGYYTDIKGADGEYDKNASSYNIVGGIQNKDGDFDFLEEGQSYYIVLAAILNNGEIIHSNVIQATYLGDDEEVTPPSFIQSTNSVSNATVEAEKLLVTNVDQGLINRLRGYILLQVENNGEAWYIDPNSDKKYYLRDREVAFTALREFGLGITNQDISKIPIGLESRFIDVDSDGDGLGDKLEEGLGTDPEKADSDGDGYGDGEEISSGYNPNGPGSLNFDDSMVSRLQGRILLQVESGGQAWYINPMDGKRYYMKDGQAAYDIMRFLSLGITNTDLRKISVGDL